MTEPMNLATVILDSVRDEILRYVWVLAPHLGIVAAGLAVIGVVVVARHRRRSRRALTPVSAAA